MVDALKNKDPFSVENNDLFNLRINVARKKYFDLAFGRVKNNSQVGQIKKVTFYVGDAF